MGGNPFLPGDLEAMTQHRRRTYALGLVNVRTRLLALHRASPDNLELAEIVVEIEAALMTLRSWTGPEGDDEP